MILLISSLIKLILMLLFILILVLMILEFFCFFHSKIIDGIAKFCGFFVKTIVLVVSNIIGIGIFLDDAAIIGLVDVVA